jgi:uncharacterized protein (TIGR02145 family)
VFDVAAQGKSGAAAFTDKRDGRIYKAVKMPDGKTWMAENLNYDTANTVGSWCYNNADSNCVKYGRLYNWNTAMGGSLSSTANPSGVQGVCPAGWHLPSRAEWGGLAKVAGGIGTYSASGTAGKALKSTSGWNDYYNGASGNGTDSLGFSALPGGYLYTDGRFSGAGYIGYWWTATEIGSGYAYCPYMGYDYDGVYEVNGDVGVGVSIRCVVGK